MRLLKQAAFLLLFCKVFNLKMENYLENSAII